MNPNPKLCGADLLECEMAKAGWVRSPNNIRGLPSVHWMVDDPLLGASPIWYAGTAGMPESPEGTEVQVLQDRIRVFRGEFFGVPYTKKSFWDAKTVAVFDNVNDFLEWCKASGRVAEVGSPFSQGLAD